MPSSCRGWAASGRTEHGYLPTIGVQVLSASVSEQAGHWSVSLQVQVQVQQDHAVAVDTGAVVGVDRGIMTRATGSDGTVCATPRHLQRRLKKLKRLHRAVSRKHKGSHHRRRGGTATGHALPPGGPPAQGHVAAAHDEAGEHQGSPRH